MMITIFYTQLLIAIYGGQLFAKYICLESKYRITLRAVVNYKISVRSYDGIRICVYKPL